MEPKVVISSGDLYTLYNSAQLNSGNEALLGVNVGPVHVASIGQADDVVLLSDNIHNLSNLLQLSLDYCDNHHDYAHVCLFVFGSATDWKNMMSQMIRCALYIQSNINVLTIIT